MLPTPITPITVTHWGIYRPHIQDGALIGLRPIEMDADPSPIADGMVDALTADARILRPAVRASFLDSLMRGDVPNGTARGREPFVEVPWDEALDMASAELDRVRRTCGNGAIFGGSYGWSSAGRFHHAQSQIHRFLNTIGGYTRSIQNYSFAAGMTILPHVVGDLSGLVSGHTSWDRIVEHTRTLLMFGGAPLKNAQVSAGGVSRHIVRDAIDRAAAAGIEMISVSPIRDDLHTPSFQYLPIRPGSDTAFMLALAYTLIREGLHDEAFLSTYTTGFDRLRAYILGETDGTPKSADWAEPLTGIDADITRQIARRLAGSRSMITVSWSLQRADYGEQPYWMAIALAAMLGQIGLPGGGFGFGYGAVNGVGGADAPIGWPSLSQLQNPIGDFIPVARIADAMLNPGTAYDFNGERRAYPDIRLVYWAGGNPFHHHQDLNRLRRAWSRPETVIVNESWWNPIARHADIVFPATTALERNDIAASARDNFIAASHRLAGPAGDARDDYDIFRGLASRLGAEETFTEGRDTEGWLRFFYEQVVAAAHATGAEMPDFDSFWTKGLIILPPDEEALTRDLLWDFRADPVAKSLKTPSGRIELFSETIASFGYDDCPGHPCWLPPREWLGSDDAEVYPLHLISNQPKTRLHSQYDIGAHSRAHKRAGREVMRIHPVDAASRGLTDGDIARVFNSRGACLVAIEMSDAVSPGVLQLPTGAWFDPWDSEGGNGLDIHGNPNVLTADRGTSKLAQGPSAQSCLVQVEAFVGQLPPVSVFKPPRFV